MLWLTGGSQEDIAQLTRLEVHVKANMLVYQRQKLQGKGETYGMARIVIGPALQALLDRLPPVGYLFPRISREKPQHRSTEFTRRCHIVGVKDRSLHGYRYGWAERACSAGMPEREAMTHLAIKAVAFTGPMPSRQMHRFFPGILRGRAEAPYQSEKPSTLGRHLNLTE